MSALVTADIHLRLDTRDEYRWGLFDFLIDQIRLNPSIKEVLILGDLTDEKDEHPSALVNRVVENLDRLQKVAKVIEIAGNHDYIDPKWPFFKFLNQYSPNFHFISDQPSLYELSIGTCLFVPCSKHWSILPPDLSPYDFVFLHQTFNGAFAENGTLMHGWPPDLFGSVKKQAISGDIHVPQIMNPKLQYVGAPYHVRFGDKFVPRVLLINDDGSLVDLHYLTTSKKLITINSSADRFDEQLLDSFSYPSGTQVKVRVNFPINQLASWGTIKSRIKQVLDSKGWVDNGIELIKVGSEINPLVQSPELVVDRTRAEIYGKYCDEKNAPPGVKELGLELLKGVE